VIKFPRVALRASGIDRFGFVWPIFGAARDRTRAVHDYQVNLKAELEIRQSHQKIDRLLPHQWERLIEIQGFQMELTDRSSL
jgi:uncharacterized membrane protein